MPLLNYTTKVPTARTIGHVQALLVEAGARSIMIDYNEVGTPTGVAFIIETMHGPRTYKLPVYAEPVHRLLKDEPQLRPPQRTPEHAERVAWRILKDWLEAQLAIIQAEQVTLDQVMLPYMQAEVGGRTVYELYRDSQLALTEGAPSAE